jgi:peptidoglycan/LPS O-acetylase OafA/YrhL
VLLVLAHNVIGPLSVLGPLLGHSERLAPILGEGPNVDLYAQHLLEGGAAAFLVGSVATHPERWPILMNPASRFFGRISYSLYVVHFAVIVACVVLLHKMLGGIPLDAPWSAPFLTVGLVLPLSIAAALLLHVAVERPGMTLGRHVARRMLGETAVAPRLGNFLR